MSERPINITDPMRRRLVSQMDFYAPLLPALGRQQCRFWVRGQDAQSQEFSMTQAALPSGEIALSVRFPVDDNDKKEDGRIYLKDSFVLSPDGRRVQTFNRTFEGGPKGLSSLWAKRLSDFQSAPRPDPAVQQGFVDQVFTAPELLKRLSRSAEAREFMRISGEAIQTALGNDRLQVMGSFRDAFFKVEKTSGGFSLKLSWLVDDDSESHNGRYIMEDTFNLNGDNFQLQSFQRRFSVHPDSKEDSEANMRLARYYGVKNPSPSEANAFVEVIVPVLFSRRIDGAPAGEMAMREGPRSNPVLATADARPTTASSAGQTGEPPKTGALPGLAGLGGPGSGPGPVALEELKIAPAPTQGAKATPFKFEFNRHPERDRTINRDNAAGWLTRTVGLSLRNKLSKRGLPGTVKFNFAIQFDEKSGYVTQVKADLLRDGGLGLSHPELKALLKDAAERIHLNFRAVPGLSGDILVVPMTVTISG